MVSSKSYPGSWYHFNSHHLVPVLHGYPSRYPSTRLYGSDVSNLAIIQSCVKFRIKSIKRFTTASVTQIVLVSWTIYPSWNTWSVAWRKRCDDTLASLWFAAWLRKKSTSTAIPSHLILPYRFRCTRRTTTENTSKIPKPSTLKGFFRSRASEGIPILSLRSVPVHEIASVFLHHLYLVISDQFKVCLFENIGQKFAMYEGKVILANLLRQFRFDIDPRRLPVRECLQFILKPENGMHLIVIPRTWVGRLIY